MSNQSQEGNAAQVATLRIESARSSGSTELDLRDLGLNATPDSLGQLSNLEYLYLGGNRLTAIPEFIGELTKLRSLSVAGNRIAVIPEFLTALGDLKFLDLGNNQISTIPDSFSRFAALEEDHL